MKKPSVSLPRRTKKLQAPTRITNETVAEHRERILAGGRRFKYPVQYARHRLVLNAILIGLSMVIIFVIICGQQLYLAQSTSSFFYRITSFIPVPAASFEGSFVRYSDYLLYYNGSAYYLQQSGQADPNTKDGQSQLKHIKRESLTNAEGDVYAATLAKQLHITVTDKEVDNEIAKSRASYGDISEQVYNASAMSVFGWTPSEYRHVMKEKLLRQKVAYQIDKNALTAKDAVAAAIKANPSADFAAVADSVNKTAATKVQLGTSGLVPLDNSDGGLSQAAGKLKVGEVSSAIQANNGSGYYFVKLLSKDNHQLNYTYIEVPLHEFIDRFSKLQKSGKINEYISVKDAS